MTRKDFEVHEKVLRAVLGKGGRGDRDIAAEIGVEYARNFNKRARRIATDLYQYLMREEDPKLKIMVWWVHPRWQGWRDNDVIQHFKERF